MAKQLTIQDLRNSILNNYKMPATNAKCDLANYYDKPQEIINYDPTCLFNGIPDFMNGVRQFDYRNSLQILNNVAKKTAIKRYEEDNGPIIDYSDPRNFIYYDKTNKAIIR